jgi:ERCC4-type nuclease
MTDKRIAEILKGITIIVDTRENENLHITDYFNAKGLNYMERKLEYGDYSFLSPSIPELGFEESFSMEFRIAIERKHDLTELSGNLAQSRDRFERELERAQSDRAKLILMVEGGSWDRIIEHKYRTDLNEKSYLASLFTFIHRYNIDIQFIPVKYAGMFIYSQFYYFLRQELKSLEAI